MRSCTLWEAEVAIIGYYLLRECKATKMCYKSVQSGGKQSARTSEIHLLIMLFQIYL